jgi:hypothetical protein
LVTTFINFCPPSSVFNANASSFAIHLQPLMEQPPNSPSAVPSVQSKSTRGAVVRILIFFALAGLFFLALDAVFTPWAFFMGGHFHVSPKWSGWGRMHSNVAGNYVIYMSISPYFGRGRSLTAITGRGALCTQRGDNYTLDVGGSFQSHPGIDLQGKSAVIYAHNYSRYGSQYSPSLEFRGKWNNPDLVLDDHGSLTQAFDPGAVLAKNSNMRPVREVVPLTLHEGNRSDFDAACATLQKK